MIYSYIVIYKPSEHDHLKMVLRSRIGSTSECFPKHQTVHRKIILYCPAQVHRIGYMTYRYIGDGNDSVNKAIFILYSMCIFVAQNDYHFSRPSLPAKHYISSLY